MKKPLLLLIFLGSIAVGWLVRGSGSVRNAEQAGKSCEARSAQRKPNKVESQGTRKKELQDFTTRMPLLNNAEKHSYIENLTPMNRGALIETILKEGSPDGLSSDGESMLENILTVWIAEDFDGAWTWSQQITNDAYRRYITGELLEEMIMRDPARAMALHLEMKAADPEFQSDVPIAALAAAARKSASDFLDILGKIPLGSGRSGSPDFAIDFDFQQAAAGISALLRKNKLPDEFPSGFVGAWAVRDPDAAFAWGISEKESREFRFNEFLEGIEKQGIPGAASAWVVGKIEESESSQKFFINHMSSAPAASISGLVKAWANPNRSDRFLTELLLAQHGDFESHSFLAAMTGMSSPQVRLDAVIQMKKAGADFTTPTQQITEMQCQAWGLTKQQFEAGVTPTATH